MEDMYLDNARHHAVADAAYLASVDEDRLRQILPRRVESAIAALKQQIAEEDELDLRSPAASMARTSLRAAPRGGIEELSHSVLEEDRQRHQGRQHQRQHEPPPHATGAPIEKGATAGVIYRVEGPARSRSANGSRVESTVSTATSNVRHHQGQGTANQSGLPPFLPVGPPAPGEPAARLSRIVVQKSDGTIAVPRRNSSSRPQLQVEESASPAPSKLRPRDETGDGDWEDPPTREEIEAAKKILQRLVMDGEARGGGGARRGVAAQHKAYEPQREQAEQEEEFARVAPSLPSVKRSRRVIRDDDSDLEDAGDQAHLAQVDDDQQFAAARSRHGNGNAATQPIADDSTGERQDRLEPLRQRTVSEVSGASMSVPSTRDTHYGPRTPVLDHLRLYTDAAPAPPIPDDRPHTSHDFKSFDGDSGDDDFRDAELRHHDRDGYGVPHGASNGHHRIPSSDYGVPSVAHPASSGVSSRGHQLDDHLRQRTSSPEAGRGVRSKYSREPLAAARLASIQSGTSGSKKSSAIAGVGGSRMLDFFSPSLFQVVLQNPTTAHQLHKYCESRLCGENIEFLQHIDLYNTKLNELVGTLTKIHKSYVSESSPKQVNLQSFIINQLHREMRTMVSKTLPSMETLFLTAQDSVQNLVYSDVYPGFVRYQLALSATRALAEDRSRYQGLGDCFCLTDPRKPDNPIVFASDGFVNVTGYTRPDIVPRNCRFLQGQQTDPEAVRRLGAAIRERKETVELLLNYKKNREPFWNLLYCAPLYDEAGDLAFFIGGQVNCSTTLHSSSDVMRVLSISVEDDHEKEMREYEKKEEERAQAQAKLSAPGSGQGQGGTNGSARKNKGSTRRNLLKAFGVRVNGRDHGAASELNRPAPVIESAEAGMEQKVLERMEGQELDAQKKEFYNAYSKYIVIDHKFVIRFYSAGITEMLHPANNAAGTIAGTDVFTFLKRNGLPPQQQPQQVYQQRGHAVANSAAGPAPESRGKFRAAVLVSGNPISIEVRLQTRRSAAFRGDERFAAHWTPLKDEMGKVGWVVLTLGAMMM